MTHVEELSLSKRSTGASWPRCHRRKPGIQQPEQDSPSQLPSNHVRGKNRFAHGWRKFLGAPTQCLPIVQGDPSSHVPRSFDIPFQDAMPIEDDIAKSRLKRSCAAPESRYV